MMKRDMVSLGNSQDKASSVVHGQVTIKCKTKAFDGVRHGNIIMCYL